MKRSGSHSWEGDSHKISKHTHQQTNRNICDDPNSNHFNKQHGTNIGPPVLACGGVHLQTNVSKI